MHRSRAAAISTAFGLVFGLAPARAARAADASLSAQLTALAREGAGKGSQTGISVFDLDAKETLFEINADTGFNPASVTKVVTTSTALRVLGSGFTFKTHVMRVGRIVDGVLQGDLVVKGEGDPSITLERLWRIASLIRVAGVHEITGNLIIDDTYFDAVRAGSGYDDFDDDRAYTAPIGATSATWNTVAVTIRPGASAGQPVDLALDPPTGFVKLINKAVTGPAGGRRRVHVSMENRIVTVSGTLPLGTPEKDYYRPIDDPPAYFGTLLSEYLAEGGILIHGKIVTAAASPRAEVLFDYESEPLGVVVRDLNKFSNNFTAEQLLKAMGAARFGAPGTSQKGLDAETEFLTALGIPSSSYVIHNGSGLNRDNKVSPRLFVKVLAADYDDFQVRGDFVASLGIAGEDGTLRHRMIGTAGQGEVRGKTGTVDGSTCLAGYALAANGHTLAFAILMNGVEGKTHHAVSTQDRIGATLAAWNGAISPATPLAKSSFKPAPLLPTTKIVTAPPSSTAPSSTLVADPEPKTP